MMSFTSLLSILTLASSRSRSSRAAFSAAAALSSCANASCALPVSISFSPPPSPPRALSSLCALASSPLRTTCHARDSKATCVSAVIRAPDASAVCWREQCPAPRLGDRVSIRNSHPLEAHMHLGCGPRVHEAAHTASRGPALTAFSGPPRAANCQPILLFPPYTWTSSSSSSAILSTHAAPTNSSNSKMHTETSADGAPRDEARANAYVDQWFLGCVREVPRACVAGSSAADVPALSRLACRPVTAGFFFCAGVL